MESWNWIVKLRLGTLLNKIITCQLVPKIRMTNNHSVSNGLFSHSFSVGHLFYAANFFGNLWKAITSLFCHPNAKTHY